MTIILITGSRHSDTEMLRAVDAGVRLARDEGWQIIVGDALGVDKRVIAQCDMLDVPVTVVGAYGKLRNHTLTGKNIKVAGNYTERDEYMVTKADEVWAVWNGTSRGTLHTAEYAAQLGKPVKWPYKRPAGVREPDTPRPAMPTTVIHISERRRTYDEVYIGREGYAEDGYFGNPHPLGPRVCPICSKNDERGVCRPVRHGREDSIAAFKRDFWHRIHTDEEFCRRVEGLRGRKLVCFCKPLPCHGDVYVAYLNWLDAKQS